MSVPDRPAAPMTHVLAGTMSAAQAQDAVTVGIDEAARRDAPLLLDLRETTVPGFAYRDAFAMAGAFADAAPDYRHRIAVLDRDDETLPLTRFFEASAAVRGLDIKTFVSTADARAWLSGADRPPATYPDCASIASATRSHENRSR